MYLLLDPDNHHLMTNYTPLFFQFTCVHVIIFKKGAGVSFAGALIGLIP